MNIRIEVNGSALEHEYDQYPYTEWDESQIDAAFEDGMVELKFFANGKRQGVRIPEADWLSISGLARNARG